MSPRRTVFVGTDPPSGRTFDWVVEPAARVSLADSVRLPDIRVVKELLDEAVPVIEALTAGSVESFLRDEFFQLVLSVARAEATLRAIESSEAHTVVATQRLSGLKTAETTPSSWSNRATRRPSRPNTSYIAATASAASGRR